jgi:hypothetical protein
MRFIHCLVILCLIVVCTARLRDLATDNLATCSVLGSSYTTFDGKRFTYEGRDSYYLVRADDFIIETNNCYAVSIKVHLHASILSRLKKPVFKGKSDIVTKISTNFK